MFIASENSVARTVKEHYELFPFPNYPILAPIDTRKGSLSSSVYAAALYEDATGQPASIRLPDGQFCPREKVVFVVGCGDTLPSVIRAWEPRSHKLIGLDLSQKNISRCRKRMPLSWQNTSFICSDIDFYMQKEGKVSGPFDHIDLYGVLHHLANPSRTLQSLARSLHPHGTMRLMVYNSAARCWITNLQRAFRYLGFNMKSPRDRDRARMILGELKAISPRIADKLGRMAPLLRNDSRFVDAFFHTREAKIDIKGWYQMISDAGLEVMGLLDEYGELDDLDNPLWSPPTAEELSRRSHDGRLENNLILFLRRPQTLDHRNHGSTHKRQFSYTLKRFKGPPSSWFQYEETRRLGFLKRQTLWRHYLNALASGKTSPLPLQTYPLKALQRLARIGALLPIMVEDKEILSKIRSPLENRLEVPASLECRSSLRGTKLARIIMDILHEKNMFSERRFFAVMERLLRAQT